MVPESSYRTIDCIHFNIVIPVLLAPRQLCRLFWVVKAGHGFLSQPCFLSIGFWIRDLASERIKSSLSVAVWGARGCSCNSLRVWMAQGKGNMISIVSLLPCLAVCAPPPDPRTHVRAIQDIQPLITLCLVSASGLNPGLLVTSSCNFAGSPPGDTCHVELPCRGCMWQRESQPLF